MSTSSSVTGSGRSANQQPTGPRPWAVLAAALGFVAFYLLADVVVSSLATGALPLPDDPAGVARAWYADNQLAATMMGLTQLLSVCWLAVFVVLLTRSPGTAQPMARRTRGWGLAPVAAMVLSSALTWLLAALAPTSSVDLVGAVRTASFVAGGTLHVLALGAFVWLASRAPGAGRALRGLALLALVVAVLSLSSLVWFYGAAFILLGRLLCMLWVVCAAISLVRGRATSTSSEARG